MKAARATYHVRPSASEAYRADEDEGFHAVPVAASGAARWMVAPAAVSARAALGLLRANLVRRAGRSWRRRRTPPASRPGRSRHCSAPRRRWSAESWRHCASGRRLAEIGQETLRLRRLRQPTVGGVAERFVRFGQADACSGPMVNGGPLLSGYDAGATLQHVGGLPGDSGKPLCRAGSPSRARRLEALGANRQDFSPNEAAFKRGQVCCLRCPGTATRRQRRAWRSSSRWTGAGCCIGYLRQIQFLQENIGAGGAEQVADGRVRGRGRPEGVAVVP